MLALHDLSEQVLSYGLFHAVVGLVTNGIHRAPWISSRWLELACKYHQTRSLFILTTKVNISLRIYSSQAESGRSLWVWGHRGQPGLCREFQVSQCYAMRPFRKNNKIFQGYFEGYSAGLFFRKHYISLVTNEQRIYKNWSVCLGLSLCSSVC